MITLRRATHCALCLRGPFTVLLVGLLPLSTIAATPDAASKTGGGGRSTSFQITGKLFGYYRMAHNTGSGPVLAPVPQFLSNVDPGQSSILFGMGDNFGPEFGARLQETGKSDDPCHLSLRSAKGSTPLISPDAYFKAEDRTVPEKPLAGASCDSVANFMERAGYRALVPGREDFLYGAGWLRDMAFLLSEEEKDGRIRNKDQKTTMLGANLRIVESKAPKTTTNLPRPCELLFGKFVGISQKQLCSNNDADQAPGQALVPEKFRLLREWEVRTKEVKETPGSAGPDFGFDSPDYRDSTQIRSDMTGKRTDEIAAVNAAITRRQLLLRDLIETLILSLPNCALSGTEQESSEVKALRAQLEPLLGQYTEGDFPATEPQWDHATSALSSLNAEVVKNSCLGATVGKLKWTDAMTQTVADLGANVKLALDQEKKFENQASMGFPDFQRRLKKESPQFQRDAQKGSIVVEPGVLAFAQAATMLTQAQSSLLIAIAFEQEDVGFTEVTTPDGLHMLVVGVIGIETLQEVQDSNMKLTLCGGSGSQRHSSVCSSHGVQVLPDVTKFKVSATDPVQTVELVMRAAQARSKALYNRKYDLIVLMAQMPHTEAEELGARIRSDGVRSGAEDIPHFDLVISEAQQDHATTASAVDYGSNESDIVPVLTPYPAYDVNRHSLINPILQVKLRASDSSTRRVVAVSDPTLIFSRDALHSAMSLLVVVLPKHRYVLPGPDKALIDSVCTGPNANVVGSKADVHLREECDLAVVHALLGLLASEAGADIAMLERRDFFLDDLPPDYDGYEVCDAHNDAFGDPAAPTNTDCHLRVALARVLWQFDRANEIMVTGKDVAGVLAKAQQFSDNRSALNTTDVAQQWLETEGVVSPIGNSAVVSTTAFSVQNSSDCHDPEEELKPSAGGKQAFCVNGSFLQTDHGYWVVTSSHIATEKTDYGLSGTNPADYVAKGAPPGLADLIVAASNKLKEAASNKPKEMGTTTVALQRQQAEIFHVDVGKVVVGYNFQRPIGGSGNIVDRFQGVSDATASSAGSANLDIEQKQRVTWEFKALGSGVQNDLEYDRQVQDNLTDKFVNGNFTKNLLSAGPFLQLEFPFRLTPARNGEKWFTHQSESKSLPRSLLVLAPAQFQTQITGTHFNFAANSGTSQIAYVTPRTHGLGERAGARHEFDGGRWFYPAKTSYFEFGGQFVQQRQVLSGLTFLVPGQAPASCPATGSRSIGNCAPKDLTTSSNISGAYASTNLYGWYWDIHLQKGYGKIYDKSTSTVTINLDSKGDFFKDRGPNHAFSTQTWYDAPASVALAFPVLRNLSFAPTYTAYFYGNQISENYLLVHTFSINLRWYLDRDSRVPFLGPALLFKGPASADETQAGKAK
jgi:hypothetical protein